MRNPNGYGTVYKMSGKRRKPFCVRKVIEYDDNGKPSYEYLGYFEKRVDANAFLAQYNMTPHEKSQKLTFQELYNMWSENHYKKIKATQPYIKAYKRSQVLYDKVVNDINQSDLQAVIDNYNERGAKVNLKLLYSLMWDYAERQEIIASDKNRTKYLDVPAQEKSTKHRKSTNDELKVLWENKDDDDTKIVLALIYTGCRPMELFKLKSYDLHDMYFEIHEGKTKNAARIVPIHEAVRGYIQKSILLGIGSASEYGNWVNNHFNPLMEKYGMHHTPYDTRHTFTSLWAENKLNEMYRRFIQGHSMNGIGEQVYTHLSPDVLYEEVNKLPISFNSTTRILHTKSQEVS